MAYSDLVIPEQRLADMLAECQTWRAIVANPDADWAALAVILDAGTVAEGIAADRIKTGGLATDREDPEFIEMPRAGVSDSPDDDTFTRSSTSSFDLDGRLFVVVEMPVPLSITTKNDAYRDIRAKYFALSGDLLELPRQHPRLDLMATSWDSGYVFRKDHNGEWFETIQFGVTYRGAT